MTKQYADVGFYHDDYLMGRGETVPYDEFAYWSMLATAKIRDRTFGRVDAMEEIPEEVQMCCCELSESEYHREKQQKESGGKTSEKIGTYSVGFASAQESATAISREQRSIVMKWLAHTGLCYQGV